MFKLTSLVLPRRKMSRYFGDISPKYRVSKGSDTIFLAEISASRFFGINLEKSAIYRDISAILVRNRRFFLDISSGQRGSTKSTRYSESQMCYSVPATVHLPNNLLLLPRGFEPQTKRFGVQPSCQLG